MRENLIAVLDRQYEDYMNLFRPGFLNSIKRLLFHPFKTLVRKIQVKVLKKKFFLVTTNTFFGYPMTIHSFEYCLWFAGCLSHSEIRLQKYILKNLSVPGIFFDVGAHHGFYSLLARSLMEKSGGEVHAFEPTDTHFEILNKNTKAFNNIYINKIAVCAEPGEKVFYENFKGKSTIEKNLFKNVPSSTPDDFTNVNVSCTTLDLYCAKYDVKPTFIKIDVEGSEYEVLAGGVKTLKNLSPVIAMEVWSKPYDNTNHLRALNFLEKNNYRAYKINDSGDCVLIQYSDLIRSLDTVGNSDNFIFYK